MKERASRTSYIHFTDEQKEQANATDLEHFLPLHGYPLKRSGKEWRLVADPSITVYQNKWFDHSSEKGGHAISLVQFLFSLSWESAITLLTGESGTAYEKRSNRQKKKPFLLPERSPTTKRLRTYLVDERKIDYAIVEHFLFTDTLYQDKKGNAVFVGVDKAGTPRLATLRSLSEQSPKHSLAMGSNRDYGFCHRGNSSSLYLFESPIDLLSYLTLYPEQWEQHSYLSLSGVSGKAALRFLKDTPYIESLIFCLDNDQAGQRASLRIENSIVAAFPKKEYRVTVRRPINKDFNEDLIQQSRNNKATLRTTETILQELEKEKKEYYDSICCDLQVCNTYLTEQNYTQVIALCRKLLSSLSVNIDLQEINYTVLASVETTLAEETRSLSLYIEKWKKEKRKPTYNLLEKTACCLLRILLIISNKQSSQDSVVP